MTVGDSPEQALQSMVMAEDAARIAFFAFQLARPLEIPDTRRWPRPRRYLTDYGYPLPDDLIDHGPPRNATACYVTSPTIDCWPSWRKPQPRQNFAEGGSESPHRLQATGTAAGGA
jgi:hypothetical protein